MARRRRSLVAIGTVLAVVVVALLSAGVVHHLTGARFVATVTPTAMTQDCVDILTSQGLNPQSAAIECGAVETGIWVRVVVKNVGHRAAYLKECYVSGLDASGRTVILGHVDHPFSFITGWPVGAGETASWEWYMTAQPAPGASASGLSVSRYAVRCPVIDYGQNVPT